MSSSVVRSAYREGVATAAMLALALLGCGSRLTREQEIELLRAQYTASLDSLVVDQDPVMAPAAAGGEGVAADESAEPVVRADAILDIRISTTAEEYLPGVTVDIEHFDAERRRKGHDTLWVDTGALVRGQTVKVTGRLENVDWDTGDGFTVEVRTPIPPGERPAYREFGGAS